MKLPPLANDNTNEGFEGMGHEPLYPLSALKVPLYLFIYLLDLSLSLQNQPTGQRLLGKLLIFLNFDSTTE